MRAHLVVIAVLAVLAVAAVTASSYVWGTRNSKAGALEDLGDQIGRVAASLAEDAATAERTVMGLAAQPGIEAALAPPVPGRPCSLASEGTRNFPVARLDILRLDGAVGCSSQPALVNLSMLADSSSSWLARAGQEPTATFFDAYDAPSGGQALVATARIGSDAQPVGIVAIVVPLAQVGDRLATEYAGAGRESFTLVDAATRSLVTSSERGEVGSVASWPTRGEAKGLDGEERLYVSTPVKETTWRVYAGRRTSLVLADARSVLIRQSGIGLVVLLLLVLAVIVLDRRVVAPIRALRTAVSLARRSAEPRPVTARGASELVDIAEEFNAVLDVRTANEAQLEHMITHDALSGLSNRVGLHSVLEEHLAQGLPAAVISLGIDRFRILNESLGHDVADRVLVQAAVRLSQALGPKDVLARFRGDEFIAFCPGTLTEEAAVEAARVMAGTLRESMRGDGYDVVVTGTAGVAVTDASPQSAGQLLRRADLAMHHAKRTGLDVAAYQQSQGAKASEHLEIELGLRRATGQGELLLLYQPVIDIATDRIIGAEALIRWAHPDRGLLPPAAFLPVAERTGQIVEIGGIALHLACSQVQRWNAQHLAIPVSVNMAVEQLRKGDLPVLVESELEASGIDPELLCLEITESSFLQNISSDLEQLAALRRLGVHLAIDDFGTGYSSLAYVQDLPVDRLKIDISFIRGVARDGRARHVVTAIIGMAQALTLTVVAEGVEEVEQLTTLEGLGCEQAQGYLIGRPMAPEDLLDLIQSRLFVPQARRAV